MSNPKLSPIILMASLEYHKLYMDNVGASKFVMKIIGLLLVFLASKDIVFAQNIDSLSYHSSWQISDTSFSIKKPNGDSTIYLFEGQNSVNSELNLQSITNIGSTTTHKIQVSNLNLSNVPTYASQDSAVKYGMINGDVYKLPMDSNHNTLLAIVNKISDPNFNFIVDNSNNDTHLKFKVDGQGNYQMSINWGDGTVENFPFTWLHMPEHIYTTPGIYHVSLFVNDYSLIRNVIIGADYSPTCNVTAFHNAQLFTNIRIFDIEGTPMSLWTYSDGFAPTLNSSWFSGNNFSSTELNKLLIYFDSLTFNAGPKTLFIQGQETGLLPTGDGLTAITSLESKGWIITR